MSGREPVAAFFPSIDRNLMAELERHLRSPQFVERDVEPNSAPDDSMPDEVGLDSSSASRPDIENVVEAVEQAASSIAAMTDHIHELEARIALLDATNRDLDMQLRQSRERHEAAEANSRAQTAHADDCERLAAQHIHRADMLERDLSTALADLSRVTDAIANALGLPDVG